MNISNINGVQAYSFQNKMKRKSVNAEKPQNNFDRIDTVDLSDNGSPNKTISKYKLESYKDGSFLDKPEFQSKFNKLLEELMT